MGVTCLKHEDCHSPHSGYHCGCCHGYCSIRYLDCHDYSPRHLCGLHCGLNQDHLCGLLHSHQRRCGVCCNFFIMVIMSAIMVVIVVIVVVVTEVSNSIWQKQRC